MYRKYYLVEVVILLLLSHGGWNGPSVTLLSCTSESSKLVRDAVQKRFLPIVHRYRVSLPMECPLHPRRDMFWWLQTEIEGRDTWKCPVCGLKFRCENTFVKHWDKSHAPTETLTEEAVCLDDYCDVFRCDVLRKRKHKNTYEGEEEQEDEMDEMIPVQHAPDTTAEETQEKEDLQVLKKQCDPKAMQSLHNKCRSLIRQCTVGMIANLSNKDFQDIEDDLDQAVCSFLTCDKYWDDYDSQIHQVPTVVCIIIGLLVTSAFCLCYYGVWLLIENNPMHSSQLCCNCQRQRPLLNHRKNQILQYGYRQGVPEGREKRRVPSRCGRI